MNVSKEATFTQNSPCLVFIQIYTSHHVTVNIGQASQIITGSLGRTDIEAQIRQVLNKTGELWIWTICLVGEGEEPWDNFLWSNGSMKCLYARATGQLLQSQHPSLFNVMSSRLSNYSTVSELYSSRIRYVRRDALRTLQSRNRLLTELQVLAYSYNIPLLRPPLPRPPLPRLLPPTLFPPPRRI